MTAHRPVSAKYSLTNEVTQDTIWAWDSPSHTAPYGLYSRSTMPDRVWSSADQLPPWPTKKSAWAAPAELSGMAKW